MRVSSAATSPSPYAAAQRSLVSKAYSSIKQPLTAHDSLHPYVSSRLLSGHSDRRDRPFHKQTSGSILGYWAWPARAAAGRAVLCMPCPCHARSLTRSRRCVRVSAACPHCRWQEGPVPCPAGPGVEGGSLTFGPSSWPAAPQAGTLGPSSGARERVGDSQGGRIIRSGGRVPSGPGRRVEAAAAGSVGIRGA